MKNKTFKFSVIALALLFVFAFGGAVPVAAKTNVAEAIEVEPDFFSYNVEGLYGLLVEIRVDYDAAADLYAVKGGARCHTAEKDPAKKVPEQKFYDLIKVSWGGDGALSAENVSVYGEYRDGNEISFSENTFDAKGCFAWEFNEMRKNSAFKFIDFSFNLKRTGALSNKETNVIITYVHTYVELEASYTLRLGVGYVAPKLVYTSIQRQWQIESDFAGIKY